MACRRLGPAGGRSLVPRRRDGRDPLARHPRGGRARARGAAPRGIRRAAAGPRRTLVRDRPRRADGVPARPAGSPPTSAPLRLSTGASRKSGRTTGSWPRHVASATPRPCRRWRGSGVRSAAGMRGAPRPSRSSGAGSAAWAASPATRGSCCAGSGRSCWPGDYPIRTSSGSRRGCARSMDLIWPGLGERIDLLQGRAWSSTSRSTCSRASWTGSRTLPRSSPGSSPHDAVEAARDRRGRRASRPFRGTGTLCRVHGRRADPVG